MFACSANLQWGPTSNAMDSPHKKLYIALCVLVVLIIGAYALVPSDSLAPSRQRDISGSIPAFTNEQLLGDAEVTPAEKQDVVAYKAQLLAKVASGALFSSEEKGSIGKLMLTDAHLYDFSDEEREAIFSALRRK